MTEADILYKAACIQELKRVADFGLPQIFAVHMKNNTFRQNVYIQCSYGVNDPIQEGADSIFRKKIMEALAEYKEWLQKEVDG